MQSAILAVTLSSERDGLPLWLCMRFGRPWRLASSRLL